MNFRLETVCPRLALARDQHNELVLRRRRHERRVRDERHRIERLIAHRELQLQRAFAAGGRRYIAERQRKLEQATAALERLLIWDASRRAELEISGG